MGRFMISWQRLTTFFSCLVTAPLRAHKLYMMYCVDGTAAMLSGVCYLGENSYWAGLQQNLSKMLETGVSKHAASFDLKQYKF